MIVHAEMRVTELACRIGEREQIRQGALLAGE